MSRTHVTVALNGDGGDESFAGYKRYLANRAAEWIHVTPGLGWTLQLLSHALPDSSDGRSRRRWIIRFLEAANRPMAQRLTQWVGLVDEQTKRLLYDGDLGASLHADHPVGWLEALMSDTAGLDPVDAAMAVDVQSYLPYDLLVKMDIATMANALEARSPFLDQEVMEFAARLPVHLKLRRGQFKYLLKRAFADLLPTENVRRGKMGFCVPVGDWFRGPLRGFLCDVLLSQRSIARGYFKAAVVSLMIREHLERRVDHTLSLWALLMLELWHRELVDTRPTVMATPLSSPPF
jgi:asparagine synthase (glutamine-hydrolysing)